MENVVCPRFLVLSDDAEDRHGHAAAQGPRRLKAIIAGGSVGGLFAANLLADLGWDVHVYERVGDDLASRGAGIGTHEELLGVLGKLGIRIDERIGVKSGDRICLDRVGNTLYRIPWGHTMSAWAAVYRPLKDRFPASRYHFGKHLVSFEDTGAQVIARFEDGTAARGDFLIGADGLRSVVRKQLYPDIEPEYAGYVAWRGTVPEGELPGSLRAWLGGDYWMVLPPGEMFLTYAIPAKSGSGRDWNIVWYRPVMSDAELRDMCTDGAGRHHGLAMPPPLIRADVIRRYKDDGHRLLPPRLAELVERTPAFFQAIFDVQSPRIVAGRTILLGDAAFVARPHVGMGVTKAALDAYCLSKSVSEHGIEKGLERYDALRGEFGRRCIARGRFVGSYIEGRARPQKHWTPEQLDQRPERVLHVAAASLGQIPELAELPV